MTKSDQEKNYVIVILCEFCSIFARWRHCCT